MLLPDRWKWSKITNLVNLRTFMSITSFRELVAWQKAMDMVVSIYRATASFPREEQYGLTNQIRRAAVSVPSNIAEGQGRETTRDFIHFLNIAYGSLQEAETQLTIAHRLNYLSKADFDALLSQCSEVGRLVNGLTRSLKDKQRP